MLTRRDFIKSSGVASGAVALHPMSVLSKFFPGKKDDKLNILFSADQIPEIKQRLELPLFKSYWEELLNANLEEDKNFLENELQFNNQIRHLPKVCEILQRESFIYVLTKDKKRGKMAKLALEKVMQFKKWDYFLEAGKHVIGIQRASQTTQSMVLAYEWIFDLLGQDEKKEIIKQIGDKGCEPCYLSLYGMLHPDEVVGWGFDPENTYFIELDFAKWPVILSRTNLRVIPMSALALGSVFLKGKDDRVDRWMDVVEKSYFAFVDLYGKDGSYPEGTGYCNYTSDEMIIMLEVLERHTKHDWKNKVNWKGVIDFWLMTCMPTNEHPDGQVNFGDGGSGFSSNIGFWIAKEYNDGVAQFAAMNHYRQHKILSPIWYNPDIKESRPQGKWFYRHFDIGWIVATTGFDKKDFVVAMRSGGPANHEHADRNSVILKYSSENLLVDQWHPPYVYSDPAWPLRTSPAHNTVLIDGKGHQYHDGSEGTNSSQAIAKVIKEEKNQYYAMVTSDATQAYQLVNANVKNVNRTLVVFPGMKFIVVVDTLQTVNDPALFEARWFVDNQDKNGKIEITDNNFVFERPEAKLIGCCAGSQGVRLSSEKFPIPEEKGIFPYLNVAAENKDKNVTLISAMIALEKNEKQPYLVINNMKNNFIVNADCTGHEVKVIVSTNLAVPKILVKML